MLERELAAGRAPPKQVRQCSRQPGAGSQAALEVHAPAPRARYETTAEAARGAQELPAVPHHTGGEHWRLLTGLRTRQAHPCCLAGLRLALQVGHQERERIDQVAKIINPAINKVCCLLCLPTWPLPLLSQRRASAALRMIDKVSSLPPTNHCRRPPDRSIECRSPRRRWRWQRGAT